MAPRPAPPTVQTADAVPAWDAFVERCGILTTVALLVAILAVTTAYREPSAMATALAGPQLLLLLVVLGCVAVLAFRRDDT